MNGYKQLDINDKKSIRTKLDLVISCKKQKLN